jgi:RNA polymerase sigma-32 factor
MSEIVSLGNGRTLLQYIREVNKFPMLSEEQELFHYKEIANGNLSSAKILVTTHLRLVVKVAVKYKNYGLDMMDVISEGNIGLMRAVKTFDWTKGYKLATYAVWWIKAFIQDYILKMWSIVKIGTSATQKKLFFNLGKIKGLIFDYIGNSRKHLTDDDINKISDFMGVEKQDVIDMNNRLVRPDVSLNVACNEDGEERIELLSTKSTPEIIVDSKREKQKQKQALFKAMGELSDKERKIIELRKLTDDPLTLKEVAKKVNVSSEGVRQIEIKAIQKLKTILLNG